MKEIKLIMLGNVNRGGVKDSLDIPILYMGYLPLLQLGLMDIV